MSLQNSHAFIFIATLVYFMFYSIFKNNKNIQIIKNHKNIFINKPWSQIKRSSFYFIFLIKIQINLILFRVYFLSIKKTQTNSNLPLGFYFKTFCKTIKKHKTNQTTISTPNYEVLIPHGYVGRGHSSFQINKKCR